MIQNRLAFRWFFIGWLCLVSVGLFAKDYTVGEVPNVRLTNRLNHVSNPDGILSPIAVSEINGILGYLEDSLGVEVAVVALSGIGDVPPREFANELFNTWRIGKAGADNGLLLQLVTAPGRRTIVFETGYGVEEVLPDAICKRIQQRYMVPLLKQNDFDGGMLAGVKAVCEHFFEHATNDIVVKAQPMEIHVPETVRQLLIGLCIIGLAIAGWCVYWAAYGSRPRCPKCHKRGLKSSSYTTRFATTELEGEYVDEISCKHCGYTKIHTHTTPKREKSVVSYDDDTNHNDRSSHRGGYYGSSVSGSRSRRSRSSDDNDSDWSGGSWDGGFSGGGGALSSF